MLAEVHGSVVLVIDCSFQDEMKHALPEIESSVNNMLTLAQEEISKQIADLLGSSLALIRRGQIRRVAASLNHIFS